MHIIIITNELPESIPFSNEFGTIAITKLENGIIQYLIEYQTKILLNVLFINGTISFHHYGLENYYLNTLEKTEQLFQESEKNLKELTPYFQQTYKNAEVNQKGRI